MKHTTWSARVKEKTKEELQAEGISAGEAIERYYEILVSKTLSYKIKALTEAKIHVLHLEENVTQLRSQYATSSGKCSTIFPHFRDNRYRDIDHLSSQDRFWIKSQLDLKDIQDLSIEDFVKQYKEWVNNGGKE